jgi:hypothetical protein
MGGGVETLSRPPDQTFGSATCERSAMNIRSFLRGAHFVAAACALVAGLPATAHANACAGLARCFDAGPFAAEVVQVVTAKADGTTAYHTVRVTLRLRNVSKEPLILAYRLGSGVLIDSNGNRYGYFSNRADRVSGIGIVQAGSADTHFQLAPGEARNATFENTIQYSPARTVLGSTYNYDLVIEQLALIGGQQVRTVRAHAIGFAGLTPMTPSAAAPRAPAAAPSGPVAVVATAPAQTTTTATPTPTEPAPAPSTGTPPAAPAADPCAPAPNSCVNAGPFIADVAQVSISKQDGVTAYQTVRITLRIRNVSAQPLTLAYRLGTGVLIDDRGNRYNYFNHKPQRVSGIGIVQAGSADAQFRLAPGQSRNATFENVIQYSSRRTVLGNAYNYDLVLAQLEALSPTQVRTVRDYALNYTNLTQMTASAPALPGSLPPAADEAAQTVQKAVDFFKALTKPR